MNAINKYRLHRAGRYSLTGGVVGASIALSLSIVFWLGTFVVPGFESFSIIGSALIPATVINMMVYAVVCAAVGAIVGFSTARIPMRIWSLRLLGVVLMMGSVALGVATFLTSTPTAEGVAMILFVVLSGLATGWVIIWRARDKVIEGL